MKKIKMIIDVDTGIDDALALSYILSNKSIDFIGATTTYGNVYVDIATRNTLDILALFKRNDIKVYQGASRAWTHEYIHKSKSDVIHGKNGIGEAILPLSENSCDEKEAAQFIVEAARKYGKELNLVFVGPLTNCANAIKLDKEAIKMVNSITIMGGAFTTRGNATLYAEANIHSDAEAAKYVFESEIPLQLIGLDVTWKTLIQLKDIEEWKTLNSASKPLYTMSEFYYNNEFLGQNTGGALHDPLAVEASVNPDIITHWLDCNMTVDTCEECYGRTTSNMNLLNKSKKYHRVALDVDAKGFIEKFVRTITDEIRDK